MIRLALSENFPLKFARSVSYRFLNGTAKVPPCWLHSEETRSYMKRLWKSSTRSPMCTIWARWMAGTLSECQRELWRRSRTSKSPSSMYLSNFYGSITVNTDLHAQDNHCRKQRRRRGLYFHQTRPRSLDRTTNPVVSPTPTHSPFRVLPRHFPRALFRWLRTFMDYLCLFPRLPLFPVSGTNKSLIEATQGSGWQIPISIIRRARKRVTQDGEQS